MPKKAYVKKVRDAIVRKLDIGYARLYEIAKKLAEDAQVTTENGIYLLAARERINLTKYLPTDKVDEIRELHLKLNKQVPSVPPQGHRGRALTTSVPRTISIGKQFTLTDPVLPDKILNEAKEMSENIYPLLYVLENSIREVILRVMNNKYGKNWWGTKVPGGIRIEVQKRKDREKENPWHGRRGAHEIYYTDILWLGKIVQSNWQDFRNIFPSITWLTQRLEEISHSRNPVAHMNPLNKKDIDRIKVYSSDWQDQIKAKSLLIPKQS